MKIHVWRGNHEPALPGLIAECWHRDELLVLCPPRLGDASFLRHLPVGVVESHGDPLPALEREATDGQAWDGHPERPVLGLFTSGTLSVSPRLVLYSKRNVEASIGGVLAFFDETRIDSVFCFPQPYHTFGLALGYLLSQLRGYRLLTAPGPYSRASQQAWFRLVDDGTVTLGTPTHFHDLVRVTRQGGHAPRASYSSIIGGAPVPVRLWHDVRDVLRVEAPSIGYGCTEASPGLTHLAPGVPPTQDGEIGVPLANVEFRAVPGGGVEFAGDNGCLAIVEGGMLTFPGRITIPDVVERRPDGRYVFRGRLGLTLNRGGEKYSLEAIELAIQSAVGLEVVCLAVPDPRLGEDLGVLVGDDRRLVGSDWRERIRSVVEEDFQMTIAPQHCHRIPSIPLTPSGKRDRAQAAQVLASLLSHEELNGEAGT